MKKRFLESLEVQLVIANPNLTIMIDNMCAEWGALPYPQLSVLLSNLKFVASIHQTHHWTSRGDSYYGDHLLFERLYNNIAGEIDAIAEKAIGMGSPANVDIVLLTSQVNKLIQGYGMTQTIPQPTELAKRSLLAEMNFLATVSHLVDSMKEMGTLSRGIDNMIAGIEDSHEGSIYLLKQRCRQNV